MNLSIVVPMAGAGSRFATAGYQKPKPFIEVLGRPMIEHVLENLDLPGARFILLVRQEHLQAEGDILAALGRRYQIEIEPIDKQTEGAACTALYARARFDGDDPLLIANSDQIVDSSMAAFLADARARALDGSILTFHANHTKWSYARLGPDDLVTEVKEKVVISPHATVGIYYFAHGRLFIDSAIDMIARNDRVNGEFYVCPVYNYAIQRGARIGIHEIDAAAMHGTGTPEDLEAYIRFRSA